MDPLKVGIYVRLVAVIHDGGFRDTFGGRFRDTFGVVSRVPDDKHPSYEFIVLDAGPQRLSRVFIRETIPKEQAPDFCARCYHEETEHVGGRCLYGCTRYKSIKEVY